MNDKRLLRAMRLGTAFSWVIGSALLFLALVGPFIYDNFYVGAFRDGVKEAADKVIASERNELILRERFLAFGHAGQPSPRFGNASIAKAGLFNEPRFRLDGIPLDNGHFLVQATSRPEALLSYWIPTLVYQHEIDANGDTVREGWKDQS